MAGIVVLGCMVSLGLIPITLAECPVVCICTPSYSGLYVRCTGKNLTRIPAGIPQNTTELHVYDNKITRLVAEDVRYLAQIQQFNAENNEISEIEADVFAYQPLLVKMTLNRNKLRSSEALRNLLCSIRTPADTPVELYFVNALHTDFAYEANTLTCLQNLNVHELDLSENNAAFPAGAFSGLSIAQLYLRSAFLAHPFDPRIFEGSGTITHVDLQRNQLSLFPDFTVAGKSVAPQLEWLELGERETGPGTMILRDLSGLPALYSLKFTDINLDIYDDTFRQFPLLNSLVLLRSTFRIITSMTNNDTICCFANYSSIKNIRLTSSFNIDLEDEYYFSCGTNLQHLDLTSYGPRPPNRPEDTFRIGLRNCPELVILILTGNSLNILWPGMFHGLPKLEKLYLSDNELVSWKASVFEDLPNLKRLKLNQNNLKTIAGWYFPNLSVLTNLTLLNIAGNPFECSCDLYWLTKSLPLLEKIRTTDLDQAVCATPLALRGEKIADYKPSADVCLVNPFPPEFYVICVLSLVVVMVMFGFAITYHYRWHIQYFLFRLKSTSKGYDEYHASSPYIYDAFVAYNSTDVLWLRDNFLPIVETKFKFKLCLHDRDWLAGVDIVDNIMASITQSRKVILIISNAFARSQWCQMEMAMAQHHLFEKDRNSLILVMLETINRQNLTPRLALQMKTQTYIEWTDDKTGNNLFFKKVYKAIGKRDTSIMMQFVTNNTFV